MFELITKGKLLRILKELCENNRAEKATGECAFFLLLWRCKRHRLHLP